MNHCGTRQLETDRLILRKFIKEDAAAMYRNWASDDEVTKYLTWPSHTSREVSQAVIEDWINLYTDKSYYQWAIVPKGNGDEPVGSISVVHMAENASMMEIGYCIGKAWWHQGITSEALQAVMDYLFDEAGAERIVAKHDPRNPNSGKVMQKCGMRYKGTSCNSGKNNQGICDECNYALEKPDRQGGRHGT